MWLSSLLLKTKTRTHFGIEFGVKNRAPPKTVHSTHFCNELDDDRSVVFVVKWRENEQSDLNEAQCSKWKTKRKAIFFLNDVNEWGRNNAKAWNTDKLLMTTEDVLLRNCLKQIKRRRRRRRRKRRRYEWTINKAQFSAKDRHFWTFFFRSLLQAHERIGFEDLIEPDREKDKRDWLTYRLVLMKNMQNSDLT